MPADESGAAFKLRAEDADDLAVISACLQDALVAVRDLAFVTQDHTFLMVANRFRWERALRPARGRADLVAAGDSIRARRQGGRDPARILRRGCDTAGDRPHPLPCAGSRGALADPVATLA